MLDKTDMEILKVLRENSKTQLKEIGEWVHLTGQAVSNRISRMEDLGIIKGYSVVLDETLLGITITAYITVFMKTIQHASFRAFLKKNEFVQEAHKISGDGCYLLKVQTASQGELSSFLDAILEFGNYRVSMSIDKIK